MPVERIIACALFLAFMFSFSVSVASEKAAFLKAKGGTLYCIKGGDVVALDLASWSTGKVTESGKIMSFDVSPDGKALAYKEGVVRLYHMDLPGGTPRLLTEMASDTSSPAISPNKNTFAYISRSLEPKERTIPYVNRKMVQPVRHIWLLNGDTLVKNDITETSVSEHMSPHWSPDGSKLAFSYFPWGASTEIAWKIGVLDLAHLERSIIPLASGHGSAWIDAHTLAVQSMQGIAAGSMDEPGVSDEHSLDRYSVYDVSTGKQLREHIARTEFAPTNFTFAGDEILILERAISFEDSEVVAYDLPSGQEHIIAECGSEPLYVGATQ